ncbi:MAG: hypothetical protein M3Z10_10290 [Gemmatimonadota bacterium]|nr:hypothetical protein [Gemmatimonadota bacterium]
MIDSLWQRSVLLLALPGFAYLVLAGWEVDSERGRTGSVILVGVALLFAIGLAMPVRGRWALRSTAGIIALAYVVSLGFELWDLAHGKRQSFRRSDTSAFNALRGLLTFGVPLLLFAIGRNAYPDALDQLPTDEPPRE